MLVRYPYVSWLKYLFKSLREGLTSTWALGLTPTTTTVGGGRGGGIALWGFVIVSSAGGYLFVLPWLSHLFGDAGDWPQALVHAGQGSCPSPFAHCLAGLQVSCYCPTRFTYRLWMQISFQMYDLQSFHLLSGRSFYLHGIFLREKGSLSFFLLWLSRPCPQYNI